MVSVSDTYRRERFRNLRGVGLPAAARSSYPGTVRHASSNTDVVSCSSAKRGSVSLDSFVMRTNSPDFWMVLSWSL